jgi:hypothetical protein
MAAGALAEATADERDRVRDSAEKWLAGVTGLMGLFGLTGVIVGRDTVSTMSVVGKSLVAVALGLAVVCAAYSTVKVHKAAFGWPTITDVSDDTKLQEWDFNRLNYAANAATHLKQGVYAAIGALALLLVGVILVWFMPAASAKTPLVRLTLQDDSRHCGKLLSSEKVGSLRIRDNDGRVLTVDVDSVERLTPIGSCPGSSAAPSASR